MMKQNSKLVREENGQRENLVMILSNPLTLKLIEAIGPQQKLITVLC